MPSDIEEYFSGRRLYGDDFTEAQLREWYDGEREGYAGSVLANQPQYRYHYHELNRFHFFGRIEIAPGSAAIGLGSAYGHEFEPIAARVGRITIIDPSDEFAANGSLGGTPLEYRKPAIDGKLDIADGQYQLATSFGSLHHIANVSGVVRELHRVLAKGGCLLVREPIVTQGDWRRPRGKLTKNERGIPYDIFRRIATDAGFRIEYSALFDFAPFTRFMADIGRPAFTSAVATRVDRGLAALFSFNKKYHRVSFLDKFGPASLAMILRKPAG
jgi:SAM-dependent methyltransferase